MSSLFFCPPLLADTIVLKNNKNLKGLVVESHADRIILSTENGEVPILLKGIKNIQYDSPEQSFMQMGQVYQSEGKYGEALAFYEKAVELGLKGFAENISDGSVLVCVQGEKSKIEDFIIQCHEGSPSAQVDRVEVTWREPVDNFDSFEIR